MNVLESPYAIENVEPEMLMVLLKLTQRLGSYDLL